MRNCEKYYETSNAIVQNRRAFTIIEAIVVTVILAILWAISFIAFQWYNKGARDSIRLTDMSRIKSVLELTFTEKLILSSSWFLYLSNLFLNFGLDTRYLLKRDAKSN